MGNNIYSGYSDLDHQQYAILSQLKPLKFHDVSTRGVVSPSRLVLRCFEHGSGVAFSDRPIHPGEIICIRVAMFQKGSFRFGITTCDPSILSPDDAESFLSRNPNSVFLGEVSSGTTNKNSLIFFKLTLEGKVVYGWQSKDKEKDKGVLIHDVPTHLPVWAVFDISGRNIALRLEGDALDIVRAKSFRRSQRTKRSKSLEALSSAQNESITSVSLNHPEVGTNDATTSTTQRGLHHNFPCHEQQENPSSSSARSLGTRRQSSTAISEEAHSNSRSSESRRKSRSRFSTPQLEERTPMYFHCKVGKNISLSCERTVATNRTGLSNGYVFTRRPLWLDEKWVVCVGKVSGSSKATLGFGLTVCDPRSVTEFPDEADELLDREEYWVFAKEACTNLVEGDELAFVINKRGEVGLSKNKSSFRTLMHVDPLMMFWAFFDVTGQVQKISSLGTVLNPKRSRGNELNETIIHPVTSPDRQRQIDPVDRAQSRIAAEPTRNTSLHFDVFSDLPPLLMPPLIPIPSNQPPAIPQRRNREITEAKKSTSPPHLQKSKSQVLKASNEESAKSPPTQKSPQSDMISEESSASECSVCLENQPNCVLYTCGHMCLCYECGQSILKSKNPLCPLCRKEINDVIKIYKS